MKIAFYAVPESKYEPHVLNKPGEGKHVKTGLWTGIAHQLGDGTLCLAKSEGHKTKEAALAAIKREWEERES